MSLLRKKDKKEKQQNINSKELNELNSDRIAAEVKANKAADRSQDNDIPEGKTEVAEPQNDNSTDGESSIDEAVKSLDKDEIIKQLEEKVNHERDKGLRLLAEYDNYRRRTQSEYRHIVQQASERLILNILPVIDDFNRFFEQNFNGVDSDSILNGIELIHRKLNDVLMGEGLKPIDSLGEEFNAEYHEAVAQIEDQEKPDGIVLVEVEKGFQLGDKIIRHPKVVVNKKTECEIEAKDE